MTRHRERLLIVLGLASALAQTAGCGQKAAPTAPIAPVIPTEQTKPTMPGDVVFQDVTDAAGLNYEWKIKAPRPLNALQTIGNGCAFLDYDGDGNLDILLVGQPLALYKGDGKGHFTDVTAQMGLDKLKGNFLGCAVGDYDNDGFPDLYVSGYRTGLLFHNERGKGFRDVTASAGLKPQPWGTSAVFFDYNGDGNLDLYVANYLQFGPETVPQLCPAGKDLLTACGPRWYKPEKGVLYRNLGRGHFADVTRSSGASQASGKGLGVAVADYDGSGSPSLAISNDEMPGDLLRNKGDGTFQNVGPESNTAYDNEGNPHGGMGIDWADTTNAGKLDLFVGTFQNEVKNLYLNQGGPLTSQGLTSGVKAHIARHLQQSGLSTFLDRGFALGLKGPVPYVTFGAKWLDADNDGFLDLMLTNGHIQDNIEKIDPRTTYRQPTQLFHNEAGAKFVEVSDSWLSPQARRAIVGRGLAVGDFDNDGRMDALVVDSEGKPLLLHNTLAPERTGHWIGLTLRQPDKNRLAYGAQVTVTAGGKILFRQCQPGGSYLSSSDSRLHFGVGSAAQIEQVVVQWPDGKREAWRNLPTGRYVGLTRGKPGFATP